MIEKTVEERLAEIDKRESIIKNLSEEQLQSLIEEINFEDGIGENAWILRREESPMAKLIRENGKEEEFEQFLEFYNWLDLLQDGIQREENARKIRKRRKRKKNLDK